MVTRPLAVDTEPLPEPVRTATSCLCETRLAVTHAFSNLGLWTTLRASWSVKLSRLPVMGAARKPALAGRAPLIRCSTSVWAMRFWLTFFATWVWMAGFDARGATVAT
jgi:hypothetical protein